MQRLTARLLLLFAIAGTFVPLGLEATTAAVHACCRRNALHSCHASKESDGLSVRGMGCCGHDCGRGVSTSQTAQPGPAIAASFDQYASGRILDLGADSPRSSVVAFHSSRAPPRFSIA